MTVSIEAISSAGRAAADKAAAQAPAEQKLSTLEHAVSIATPSLKEVVTSRVLSLFHWSLIGTLVFAGALALIDAFFIASRIISPEQRLMTEKIIMTFVTATVVQVGAAMIAIVYAVFKTEKPEA